MGPRRGKLVAGREAHDHVHIAAQREAQYANIQEIRLNVWLGGSKAREVEGQLAGYLLGWRRDFLGKIVLAWLVFFHLIFNFQGLLVS